MAYGQLTHEGLRTGRTGILAAFGATAHRVQETVAAWRHRQRARANLGQLMHSPHLMEDIGLTPGQARREINKFFWQD